MILPARVRAPDDKAKVENAVRLVSQSILAPLRDRTFFCLAELNHAIAEGVAALNARAFSKREGNRITALAEERVHLAPLPDKEYSYGQWKRAKVHVDYHIEVDKRLYSVPHALIGKTVDVRTGDKLLRSITNASSSRAPDRLQAGRLLDQARHCRRRTVRTWIDQVQLHAERLPSESTAAVIARRHAQDAPGTDPIESGHPAPGQGLQPGATGSRCRRIGTGHPELSQHPRPDHHRATRNAEDRRCPPATCAARTTSEARMLTEPLYQGLQDLGAARHGARSLRRKRCQPRLELQRRSRC